MFKQVITDLQIDNYDFLIGTIKGLEIQYGIEYLIEAFCMKLRQRNIKLLIVRGGTLEEDIKGLVFTKGFLRML
jgi:hypothetical protein